MLKFLDANRELKLLESHRTQLNLVRLGKYAAFARNIEKQGFITEKQELALYKLFLYQTRSLLADCNDPVTYSGEAEAMDMGEYF